MLCYSGTGQIWNDDRRRIGLLGLDHHHALAGVVMVIDQLSQKACEIVYVLIVKKVICLLLLRSDSWVL